MEEKKGWYEGVPVPVDKNGNVVPLDTRELVDDARLSNMDPVDVFTCPSCGFVGCVVEYQQNGEGYWDLDIPCECEPRFCPNCGTRMVMGDE